jgi:hypothetical protein
MEIAFHLGAHVTDEERLIRCLLRNRGLLAGEGIAVPGTTRYRKLLRQSAAELGEGAPDPAVGEALLDAILSDEDFAGDPGRIVFSFESFLAFHPWAVQGTRLYPEAGVRARRLRALFPQADVSFHIAIRDPATFLPALVAEIAATGDGQPLQPHDPAALRWSDTLLDISRENPDCALFVWCDEDTPLLWPEILRSVAGHGPETVLEGVFDWYKSFVSAEGLAMMTRWLQDRPPMTDLQRRKVLSAFLDKFALPEQMEVDAGLEMHTEAEGDAPAREDIADGLSALYAEDLDLIAQIEAITLLEA